MQAALDLLEDLMSHDTVNFREGTDLIRHIHLMPYIIKYDQLDFTPAIPARSVPSQLQIPTIHDAQSKGSFQVCRAWLFLMTIVPKKSHSIAGSLHIVYPSSGCVLRSQIHS